MKFLSSIIILLLFAENILGQVYKGKILDKKTGIGIPFVTIITNCKNKGTTTNEKGEYSLKVSEACKEMVISSIGYESVSLIAGNESTIYLTEKESQLNEFTFHAKNPAIKIISNVLKNKPTNDPEQNVSFKYDVYHKTKIIKESSKELKGNAFENDLYVNESFGNRKFLNPNLTKETIIGSKTSGTKSTLFSSISPLLQQFSFYKDIITFQGRRLQEQMEFINPLAEGTFSRYYFNIADTTINFKGDSTFVIEFEPKNNTKFKGLKGLMYIHSGDYALQYVVAEPSEKQLLHFKITQEYELLDGKKWFPKELHTVWQMAEFNFKGQQIKFDISSYLSNIQINIPIVPTDFDENSLVINNDAIYQNENFWKAHRTDSLSQNEKNTYQYHKNLAFTKKVVQNAALNATEWFTSGIVPLGKKLDLSIQNLFDANIYEGIRPSINILTNDNLFKFVKFDAKLAYGFNDRAFKYESRVRFNLNEKSKLKLSLQYRSDVSEPGNVQYFIWNFPQIPYELLRTFQLSRADSLKQYKAEVNFKAFKYSTISLSYIDETRNPSYKYMFHNPMLDPAKSMTGEFHTTEVGVGIRFAFGEQFSQIGRGSIITATPSPTISAHFASGNLYFPEGIASYTKINAKIEYGIKSAKFGETFFNLSAGKIWGNLPYPYLYNGQGSKDNNVIIWVANHFQTMRLYEFTSDKYANLFINHNFRNLLFKPNKKWFRPEVSISQGIAFGSLDNLMYHEGIDLKSPTKGYFESGLIVDNIYRQKLMKLFYIGVGAGVFKRWGYYQNIDKSDNYTYRLVWNIGF